MTDKEVLQKVIEKVSIFKNGSLNVANDLIVTHGQSSKQEAIGYALNALGWNDELNYGSSGIYQFVYSNEFAKALWGEEFTQMKRIRNIKGLSDNEKKFFYNDWEIHLRNMVILENPIDYLRKFIDITPKP